MGKYSKKFNTVVTLLLVMALVFSAAGVSAGVTDEDHDPTFFDDLGILQELNKTEEQQDPGFEEVPEEDRDANENLDYMRLLSTLGILEGDENGELNPYRTITRAEFTVISLRLAGLSDDYFMNIAPGTQNFSDVPTDSWYYGAVKAACEMGLVNGYTDGTFKPDRTVSFNEAVKLIVCAIGYGGIAEETGTYPVGYITVANKLKLTKNVSPDKEDKTLRKTVGKIMYNALQVNALSRIIDSAGGDVTFIESGETIGERYFGVEKKKGILEGVNEQMLGGVSDRENVVYVSSESYVSVLAPELKEYIGSYVEIFVATDEKERKEIIYYSTHADNSILTVDFENIISVDEKEVKLDLDEISKIKLDSEPSMIFNERAVVPFNYELIKPVYYDETTGTDNIPYGGGVTFTDNNGDGKYDIAYVVAYRSMYLGKVLGLKKTIMDYYVSESGGSQVIDLNPRNLGSTEVEYVMETGKEGAFTSMKAGYVVDIYSSADLLGMNKKVKIVITNRSISGKVNRLEDDYVEIGGTEYKLSPYYKNNVEAYPDYADTLELGANVKVALNAQREVVAVLSKADSNNVGYMLDYIKSGDDYVAEIADTDGRVKKYSFAQSIRINGEKATAKEAYKLIEETGKANAPVSYSLDSSERLKTLDIHTLKNPGLVQTVGVGKSLKIDSSVLSMGDSKYTHTFVLDDFIDLDEVPIIGIDFGAAGADNSRSPESGLARVESANTVKVDKSYIGVNRNSENYGNNYYEDRIYLVNYDETKETCDLIIFNIGAGGLEENDVMAPYTIYGNTGNGYQNRFMSVSNAIEFDSKTSDSILCVNDAYSMKNEDDETIWLVEGIQGGSKVTYSTAPGMKYLTSMNVEDDRINSTAPVQWSPERGATYASANEEDWFAVSGAKDFYNPSTGEMTYTSDAVYYFPERFRTENEPGIKMGDMAFISTNSKGEIVEFQYIANAVDGPERTLCGRPRRATMVRGYCWEPFYGMDKDTMNSYYLSNHNHADMAEADISETIRTTAWDGENEQFISVTRDDLYGCDTYIEEIDGAEGYTKTGENNNCWLLMNKYNWECTEIIFVDYVSNTY